MRGREDLGIPSAGLVVVLLFLLPLFALLARRRWRLAEARGEEVRRLLRLAAAEDARAEAEAAQVFYVSSGSYGAGGGDSVAASGGEGAAARMQCAVCYSPTTTRCARCKGVRYCSGKCQIIHWRQGHREECHPPGIEDHCNGLKSYDLKGTEQSDLCNIDLENEGTPPAIPDERPPSESNFSSEIFSEDDNHVVEPFIHTPGTDSTPDSFADSLSSSSFGPVEEVLHDEYSHPYRPITEADVSELSPTKIAGVPVNNLNCTGNFTQKEYSCQREEVNPRQSGPLFSSVTSDICRDTEPSKDSGECQAAVFDSNRAPRSEIADSTDSRSCEEGDRSQVYARSSSQVFSKLSGQGMSSQLNSRKENSSSSSSFKAAPTEVSAKLDLKDTTDLGFNKSGSVARGRCNDVLLLKTKGLNSLSSISSTEQTTFSGGGHPVSRDTSSSMDSAPPVRSKLCEGTVSVSNGISDIKTSVRKVVQQFKPSQILRHYPPVFRSDLPGKYKMLFPYDLFIKLYNCDKAELRPCGLTNCGNSCYANAVLQCLAFTRPLSAYLLQGLHSKTCPKREWCFTCEFESLLMKAKEGQSPLSPIGILSHIRNIGSNLGYGREEDAHEFLRYAIDTMQSVCLKEAGADAVGPLAEETTLIQLMFGGYLLSKIKCMRCRGKSERRERMMDLTVEIHGDIGTLDEALARFTATEILDGENKYQCNRCKSYERAKKKLNISEAPNILTIALKRFQSGKFGKLNKAVRFPEFLNLAPYMSGTNDKSPVYRLYGVVVHLDIMNAAFSGHYVCYVKSAQKKWYKIDDSKVKPVELERVLSKNAYMLLYARCSPRAPSVIRNTMSHEHAKNKSRCGEVPISGHGGDTRISKTRPTPMIPRAPSEGAHERSRDHPYRPDHHASLPFDLFDERFRKTDSSSDCSSLLSCSDEGSWSTESTRNSICTEEFSEYIYGDPGWFSSSSSSGFSEDSDGQRWDPPSGREGVDESNGLSYGDGRPRESKEVFSRGEEAPPFLYSRKLTDEGCRSREADRINPYEVQSSVPRRRCTSEKTTQTFFK